MQYIRLIFFSLFSIMISLLTTAQESIDVPREKIPEPAHRLFKETFEKNNSLSFNKNNAIKVFDEVCQITQFPKYSELEYLEVFHPRAKITSYKFWGKKCNDKLIIVTADFTSKVLSQVEYSRAIPADFLKDLAELNLKIESFQQKTGEWNAIHPKNLDETNTSTPDNNSTRKISMMPELSIFPNNDSQDRISSTFTKIPLSQEDFLFQTAFAAACLNEVSKAHNIFNFLLDRNPYYFANSLSFTDKAISNSLYILGNQRVNPFTEFYLHLEATLKTFPGLKKENDIKEIIADSQSMVNIEKNPVKIDIRAKEVTLQQKIDYYISRLPYAQGMSYYHPGDVFFMGESAELVKIGLPAIPALMDHLTDNTPSTAIKSYGMGSISGDPKNIVRVKEIARDYIRQILKVPEKNFMLVSAAYIPPDSDYDQRFAKHFREWWNANQGKSLIELQISLMDIAPFSVRMSLLHNIENSNPNAIDTVPLLKKWLKEFKTGITTSQNETPSVIPLSAEETQVRFSGSLTRTYEYLFVTVANELKNHGDSSAIPEALAICRKSIQNNHQELNSFHYLCNYGTIDDYKILLAILQQEITKSKNSGSMNSFGSLFNCLKETKNPFAIPLFLLFLDNFTICESGSDMKGNYERSYADISINNLIRLTRHNEGFDFTLSPENRKNAIKKWLEWWKNQGKKEIINQYPDILQLLNE